MLQIVGWVGGEGGREGKIVIPESEALRAIDKKRLFFQNFFPDTILGRFLQLSTSFHYSTSKQFHYGLKNNTSRF
jgi:hypothetical protein